MKHAWRHGTAPKCTAEVPEFVERHVHDNYVLTAGVKSLPIHRHLLHVERPTILRKPPHTVHKTLRGGSQRRAPPPDRISGHPYKHAAAIASSRRHRTDDIATIGGDSDDDERQAAPPAPSLFGVAGVIGGPEFDPYLQYRHNIYPFKEQLAHEVNKLVLEKENLDRVRKQAAAAASRNRRHHHHGAADDDDDDNTDSSTFEDDYDGGSETETLMSSSTLIDDDDNDDEYDEEEDILPVD